LFQRDYLRGISDQKLVKRFLSGDKSAFDALVLRHELSVRSILYRITGNSEDAKDMAQETFIRAYQNLSKFQERSSMKTWILRIAVNIALDAMRKLKRNPSPLSLSLELTSTVVSPSSEDPQNNLSMKEKGRALTLAMEKLPFKQRSALALKVSEGMKYKEIANVLEISEDAAKANVHLARKRIILLMDDHL